MVGSVFTRILGDLEQEGWMEEASEMKKVMDKRIEFWQSLTFPFGSEMAWDNTGHEEIYSWLSRIGDEARSESTRNSRTDPALSVTKPGLNFTP